MHHESVPDHTIKVRRMILTSIATAVVSPFALGQSPETNRDDAEEKEVLEIARKAKLRPFQTRETPRFRVFGDAPESFLALTLRDCESIATDFCRYYEGHAFPIKPSVDRLSVVALKDDKAFAAFLGIPPNTNLDGLYSKTTNRLVVYDFRPSGPQAPLRPGYANLRTLAHETTHQLCFNTGLLQREGDVPLALVEGMAMLGEVRKFNAASLPGGVNALRLENIATLRRRNVPWIPLKTLIRDDELLRGSQGGLVLLLGYAQAWLLVYALMTNPRRREGFKSYLQAIGPRRKSESRLEDAKAHWGDLDEFDNELNALAVTLLKSNF